jgi:hypothetical protein
MASNTNGYVFYYDHDTETFSDEVLVHTSNNDTDKHDYMELQILDSGHLVCVAENLEIGTHNSELNIYMSDSAEDISAWTNVQTLGDNNTNDYVYTYPSMRRLHDGTILLSLRMGESSSNHYRRALYRMEQNGASSRFTNLSEDTGDNIYGDVHVNMGTGKNYWAYGELIDCEFEGYDDYIACLVRIRNYTDGVDSEIAYIIYTQDGITWGNIEWMRGLSTGTFSKNIEISGAIDKDDLDDYCIYWGAWDATNRKEMTLTLDQDYCIHGTWIDTDAGNIYYKYYNKDSEEYVENDITTGIQHGDWDNCIFHFGQMILKKNQPTVNLIFQMENTTTSQSEWHRFRTIDYGENISYVESIDDCAFDGERNRSSGAVIGNAGYKKFIFAYEADPPSEELITKGDLDDDNGDFEGAGADGTDIETGTDWNKGNTSAEVDNEAGSGVNTYNDSDFCCKIHSATDNYPQINLNGANFDALFTANKKYRIQYDYKVSNCVSARVLITNDGGTLYTYKSLSSESWTTDSFTFETDTDLDMSLQIRSHNGTDETGDEVVWIDNISITRGDIGIEIWDYFEE